MSQKRSSNGDELAGVENVFEKNFKQFNNILSHSDASEQLAQVKKRIKNGGQVNQMIPRQSNIQLNTSNTRNRKAQISRLKK